MKKALSIALAACMALGISMTAFADEAPTLDYPKSNITCIIPYGAGGTMDMLSRSLFESIPEGTLPKGVNFVVENVAGSGGLVGTEQALTKPADGYTICGVNGDLIINRAIGATDIILQENRTLLRSALRHKDIQILVSGVLHIGHIPEFFISGVPHGLPRGQRQRIGDALCGIKLEVSHHTFLGYGASGDAYGHQQDNCFSHNNML